MNTIFLRQIKCLYLAIHAHLLFLIIIHTHTLIHYQRESQRNEKLPTCQCFHIAGSGSHSNLKSMLFSRKLKQITAPAMNDGWPLSIGIMIMI